MQRAGAMNLLSFLLNDMTEENRKLKLIIFPGETVVIDEYGKRIVACPTEDEAEEKNISGNRRNDIDETEQGRYCIANLESVSKGSIQKYTRPYIIISNNKANQYSPVVTAVAMSTKTWKKKYLPTHCPIPAAKVKVTDTDFEVFDSMALCEQIVSIDVNVQIERVVASISDTELLDKITECVKIQIGAYEKYN